MANPVQPSFLKKATTNPNRTPDITKPILSSDVTVAGTKAGDVRESKRSIAAICWADRRRRRSRGCVRRAEYYERNAFREVDRTKVVFADERCALQARLTEAASLLSSASI